jgi:hypothetical protein
MELAQTVTRRNYVQLGQAMKAFKNITALRTSSSNLAKAGTSIVMEIESSGLGTAKVFASAFVSNLIRTGVLAIDRAIATFELSSSNEVDDNGMKMYSLHKAKGEMVENDVKTMDFKTVSTDFEASTITPEVAEKMISWGK